MATTLGDGGRIPVTVLTGFLGSGKTTILSRLVAAGALSDAAVILNEFGEVGLDHLLLEASDETVVDLSCGCVCCTIRGDLVATLADLHGRRERGAVQRFRRVVLETTGLADPAPIIHTFLQEPSVLDRYRLAGVVTAVDAVNAPSTLDAHPQAVRQVALADEIVVTKADLHGAGAGRLDARLAAINPGARRTACVRGRLDPRILLGGPGRWPGTDGPGPGVGPGHGGDGMSTFVVSRDEPLGRGALAMFLQMLADQRGEELLRVKGLAALADDPSRPLVVHGVQHVVHPHRRLDAWPPGVPRATRLVFIVRDLERAWVESLLGEAAASAYAAVPRPARPPGTLDGPAGSGDNRPATVSRNMS